MIPYLDVRNCYQLQVEKDGTDTNDSLHIYCLCCILSCIHKILVVSTAAGLGALLHILSVTSLLEGLPGHVLLDVLALLPGGGGALPAGGAGAVLEDNK